MSLENRLPEDIPFLSTINPDFLFTVLGAIDTEVIRRGKPHGGLVILWKKSLSLIVKPVDCKSKRLTGIYRKYENMRVLTFRSEIVICEFGE